MKNRMNSSNHVLDEFIWWMNSSKFFFQPKPEGWQMAAKKQETEINGRQSQNQKADKCRHKKKKLKIMVSILLVAAPKLPINYKLMVYLHWFLRQKKKKLKIMVSVLLVAAPKLPINYNPCGVSSLIPTQIDSPSLFPVWPFASLFLLEATR